MLNTRPVERGLPVTAEQEPITPSPHDPASPLPTPSEKPPEDADMTVPRRAAPSSASAVEFTLKPDPNGATGLGRFLGPVAQFGAVGLMGLILYNLQKDTAQQTRESHKDTMVILNKSLDRLESNQTENGRKFETMQQDATRRDEKNAEKFDKVFTEVQTGRKEMVDKIDKLISGKPPQ